MKILEALYVDTILGRFDVNRYKRFKKEYDKAVKNNKPSFIFEGQTVLTGIAKYIIEYLTPNFGGIKETMKKEVLKSLIREVVKEMVNKLPPKWKHADDDHTEILNIAQAKNPFLAYQKILDLGFVHPILLKALKGSPYEKMVEKQFHIKEAFKNNFGLGGNRDKADRIAKAIFPNANVEVHGDSNGEVYYKVHTGENAAKTAWLKQTPDGEWYLSFFPGEQNIMGVGPSGTQWQKIREMAQPQEQTHFPTLSEALAAVERYLEINRAVIDPVQYPTDDADIKGVRKPFMYGGIAYEQSKQHLYPLIQYKGKPVKNRGLFVSIYRMPSGSYELTRYIS
jgi:hypothetical protein